MPGDIESFDALYRRHAAAALSYARLLLGDTVCAEDCVQDVFLSIWKNRHLIGTVDSFNAYILKAVHNKAINYLTRNMHGRREGNIGQETSNLRLLKYFYCHPESEIIRNIYSMDMRKALDRAIASLPPREREIFCMSYIEEIPDKEIGRRLGLSVRTIQNCVYRALKKLRSSDELKQLALNE